MSVVPIRGEVSAPAWTRDPHVRRLRAVRLARLMAPGAHAAGLYPSGELCVAVESGARRPLVCVAAGDPPVDGVLTEPPVLVVEPAGVEVASYLRAGAQVAWAVGASHAEVHPAAGPASSPQAGDVLHVPGWPTLSLPVTAVTAALGEDARATKVSGLGGRQRD